MNYVPEVESQTEYDNDNNNNNNNNNNNINNNNYDNDTSFIQRDFQSFPIALYNLYYNVKH